MGTFNFLPQGASNNVAGANFGTGGGANAVPFGSGQNQWMSYPTMGYEYSGSPGMATAPVGGYGGGPTGPVAYGNQGTQGGYTMPGSYGGGYGVPSSPGLPYNMSGYPTTASKAGGFGLQGGAATVPTQDPQFSQAWANMLQQQMGQGLQPFNLSTYLPSSGTMSQPGQLTAPLTQTMQGLQDFYSGRGTGVSGVPLTSAQGGGTSTSGAGSPLSYVLPMWQSEIGAMQQPIQQQLANIKEQFGAQGALGSSEMATALQNYGEQTAAQEQSLLGQLTMQALPQQQSFATGMQGLDQQAIQNMYQEFLRTQPQYNPLLGAEQSLATTYPSIYTKQGGVGGALMGQAGNLLGMAGGLGGSIAQGLSGGGGITDVLSSIAGMFL